jgi:hypothetical protein
VLSGVLESSFWVPAAAITVYWARLSTGRERGQGRERRKLFGLSNLEVSVAVDIVVFIARKAVHSREAILMSEVSHTLTALQPNYLGNT